MSRFTSEAARRRRIPRLWSRGRTTIWIFLLLFIPLKSSPDTGVTVVHAMTDEEEPNHKSLRVSSQTEKAKEFEKYSIREKAKSPSLNQILIKAGKRGLGGGIPGAIAGVVQVITLMWLRTIINYQCRYGTTFGMALKTLLREGGVARLYRGLPLALIQAPLARFASTAANDGVQAFLGSFEATASWGPGSQTVVASVLVGIWRILLMPIDTMKTVLQVDSTEGFRTLVRRVKSGRINVLYQGSLAQVASAILGHYPWFYTYNWLAASQWVLSVFPSALMRNGVIGMAASVVADTCTNCIRVIKTNKQSLGSKHNISYMETIRMILAADGWAGLFGRGLRTRYLANAVQSIVFTIIWRGLAESIRKKPKEDD